MASGSSKKSNKKASGSRKKKSKLSAAEKLEAILNETRNLISKGLDELHNENFTDALQILNRALELCPEEHPLSACIYELRGKVHQAKADPGISKDALNDWTESLRIEPGNPFVLKLVSLQMFKRANKFFRDQEYQQSADLVQDALTISKENKEAYKLLKYLKTHHPDAFVTEPSPTTLAENVKQWLPD